MKKKLIICVYIILCICLLSHQSVCGKQGKTKQYTISKESGQYKLPIKIKIKVNKGYKVYYTKGKKFSKNKCIMQGKSKVINIKKNTTLTIYFTKSKTTISNKSIKKLKVTSKGCVRYKYIEKNGQSINLTDNTNSNSNTIETAKPYQSKPTPSVKPKAKATKVPTKDPTEKPAPTKKPAKTDLEKYIDNMDGKKDDNDKWTDKWY